MKTNQIMKKTTALLLTAILFFFADFAHAQSKPKREGYVTSKTCTTKAEAYADAASKIPMGAIPSKAGYNGSGDGRTGIGRWSCNLQWIIFSK
jgi:hypothetical protein